MVTLEEAIIARLETQGSRFEVLVDPDLALEFKRGKDIDLSDMLAVETIFKDAKKGEKASEEHVKKVLETEDLSEAAKKIIRKGEIHLTTEQRKKLQEERKRQIITMISRQGINPQTGAPHPPARIEKAMDEAKVHVDMSKDAEGQVPKILKALRPIIPIRFEERKVAVKIPAHYVGRSVARVKSFGKIEKEEWQKDGSWIFIITLPAGMVDEFYDEVNGLTKGEVETKVIGETK